VTDSQRLLLVRALHSAIYLVMAAASLLVLFAGLTGARGPWLWVALVLVLVESLVFVGCGFKCPLTAVATRYGASPDGAAFDTFLPDRITRHTFRVFGPIIAVGLLLLALRWIFSVW
jgi:hypothetical protein